MLNSVLKNLLLKIVADLDSGNSNISEEDEIVLVKMLRRYTRKDSRMSKVQCCSYLHVSRATFDNYVREGKIPKGRKQTGFKELFWTKNDLDKYKEQC